MPVLLAFFLRYALLLCYRPSMVMAECNRHESINVVHLLFEYLKARHMKTCFLVFAAVLLLNCVTINAQDRLPSQVMGIPRSTVVTFGDDPQYPLESKVAAFCLELRVRRAPSYFDAIPFAFGEIEVTYVNGEKSMMSLQTGITAKLISFVGASKASNGQAVHMTADPRIKYVTFLSDSALGDESLTGSQEKILSRLRKFAAHFDEATKTLEKLDPQTWEAERINIQQLLWQRPLPFESAEPEKDGGTTVDLARKEAIRESIRTNESQHGKWKMFAQSTQADCNLMRTLRGANILHDVGTSEEELNRVVDEIDLQGGVRRISVFITHAHLDHYKGLTHLLARPDVYIEQIFIGFPWTHASEDDLPDGKFGALLKQIYSMGLYDLNRDGSARVTHFIRKHTVPSIKLEVWDKLKANAEVMIASITDGLDTLHIYWPTGPVDAKIRTKHDYNLVTVFQCNQTRILDFGDADVPQIRALVRNHVNALDAAQKADFTDSYKDWCSRLSELAKSILGPDEHWDKWDSTEPRGQLGYREVCDFQLLEVDVLKWTHHAWRPVDQKDRELMKLMLKLFRPREIVFSVRRGELAEDVRERLRQIEELIQEAKEEESKAGRLLEIPTYRTEVDQHYRVDSRWKTLLDLKEGYSVQLMRQYLRRDGRLPALSPAGFIMRSQCHNRLLPSC